MRLASEAGDFVEIARLEDPADDLRLTVSVARAGFAGTATTWVEAAAWERFVCDLERLDERRLGEARLEGMSPEELVLQVRSIDEAGHLGVEGLLGRRTQDTRVTLRFSILVFDPAQLAVFARAARELGATPSPGSRDP
jgi:hypothetical protein